VLNYTYPIWANVLAFWLGTRQPLGFWLFLLLSVLGVGLVANAPHNTSTNWLGTLIGLGSAFVAGGAVLTIKKLRETEGELMIVLAFSIGGLLVSTPILLFVGPAGSAVHPADWTKALALLGVVGLSSFGGHLLFTRAYKLVSVGIGTLLSLIVPLISLVLGTVILEEDLSGRQALGAALILGGMVGGSLVGQARRNEAPVSRQSRPG